jgi:hypothetical protein
VIFTGKKGELKGSCGGVGANPDCCQKCDKDECESEAEASLAAELAALPDGAGDHPLLAQAD